MAESRRTERTLPPDVRVDPERELPQAKEGANPRLNEAAETIGSALGSATRQVQNVRDRLTVIRGGAQGGPSIGESAQQTAEQIKETAQQKVEEVKERASSALEQAKIQATARAEDMRMKASQLARNARESAAERARLLRYRAARLAEQRPLTVLAAIGGAAFLLGIFLRVGRGRRG